jgi:carboxyl-terminal processing protease
MVHRRSGKSYLSLIAGVIALLVFSGAHTGQRAASAFDGQDDGAAETRIVEGFQSALNVAKSNYAGAVDTEKVLTASIDGMLKTLDPHSSYFDRKAWQDFQSEQRSTYSGIGTVISPHDGKVFIWSPFDRTAAYKAGLLYGDQIVAIDGESAAGWGVTQVQKKLLGPSGTQVTVKVAREGVPEPLEFKLTRGSVPTPSIPTSYIVGNGVGYVGMQGGFNLTTADELTKDLQDLHSRGMTSLIIDLRGNRGGLVEQAYRVVNNFLYAGQRIVLMKGRPGVFPSSDLKARNSQPDDFPIVVMVDRGTASAAEIVAGALQDHDRAVLVGESSFGKGLVQTPYTLRDGSGLILTQGKYYTPSGRLIQRDYSGRSFYDYYLQRGDKEALEKQPREEKRTDSGRPVYGGDGITPDVEAKIPPHYFELLRDWTDPVFAFAHALIAGEVPGLAEFKIDHRTDHSHILTDSDYVVNDKVLDAFKKFLSDHKGIKAPDQARLQKDAGYVKLRIRYEVVTAAYGQEISAQVLLKGDPQMQVALANLPTARKMADDFVRVAAARPAGRPGD